MELLRLLHDAAQRNSSRSALRYDHRSWTFAELQEAINAIAAGLHDRRIRRGDRIAFLLPNGPELVFLHLACLKLGAIAVPMNVRLKGAELAYILSHSRARLAVIHADLYPNLQPVRGELKQIEALFLVGANQLPADCEPFDRLKSANAPPSSAVENDDAAAILYTSGTTARPKGVTHTHRGLSATVRNFTAASHMTAADAVLGMLSMSHIFGYTLQLLSPLSVGATVLIAPTFDAANVLGLVARHRVTHLYGLPVMFDAIARQPLAESVDLSSLRYCLAGGDSVPATLHASMKSVLGLELYEGCGMTEVIPYALNRPGLENRRGSIGPPSAGMRLRLVDEAGQDVAEGTAGEILVASDGLTIGYWEDPEATAAVLQDGWFHTGDLGRKDEAGYYWFVGRRKEIIVRGGSNIAPLEVEGVLGEHPAVQEVAVVGVPHPTLGETVAAYVVLKAGGNCTQDELRHFAAERMAQYKVPDKVTFLNDLPRGTTGKVHRKTLKEWASS
jgi:long-chain acyl-CoA synthetase